MTDSQKPPGIIILGAPRSGTTLLRRILNAHPAIACPGETNVFSGCGRFLREEHTADGTAIGPLSGLSFAGIEPARVRADLRQLAFGYLEEFAASEGKTRWAEKTAFNSFYLDELEPLWGDDVQFVLILRHGLDVTTSIQDLCDVNGAYLEEVHRYVHAEPIPKLAFARLWVDVTERLLDFAERHVERTHRLRYEDLVTTPENALNELFAFLGEDWSSDGLAAVFERTDDIGLGDWKTYEKNAVSNESVGKWRRLPAHLLSRLAPIVNPTLERCGYEPVKAKKRSVDDPQRRYELAMMLGRMKQGD